MSNIAINVRPKHARASGILYLITFAASIPVAFDFLTPVISDPNYIVGSGADSRVIIGCLLDVVNALACIGTAVAVYPVAKRQTSRLRSASSPPACSKPRSS